MAQPVQIAAGLLCVFSLMHGVHLIPWCGNCFQESPGVVNRTAAHAYIDGIIRNGESRGAICGTIDKCRELIVDRREDTTFDAAVQCEAFFVVEGMNRMLCEEGKGTRPLVPTDVCMDDGRHICAQCDEIARTDPQHCHKFYACLECLRVHFLANCTITSAAHSLYRYIATAVHSYTCGLYNTVFGECLVGINQVCRVPMMPGEQGDLSGVHEGEEQYCSKMDAAHACVHMYADMLCKNKKQHAMIVGHVDAEKYRCSLFEKVEEETTDAENCTADLAYSIFLHNATENCVEEETALLDPKIIQKPTWQTFTFGGTPRRYCKARSDMIHCVQVVYNNASSCIQKTSHIREATLYMNTLIGPLVNITGCEQFTLPKVPPKRVNSARGTPNNSVGYWIIAVLTVVYVYGRF